MEKSNEEKNGNLVSGFPDALYVYGLWAYLE
jgi:hypothetical protein